jgi:hypothetical protein
MRLLTALTVIFGALPLTSAASACREVPHARSATAASNEKEIEMRTNQAIRSKSVSCKITQLCVVVLWTLYFSQSIATAAPAGDRYNLYFGDLHNHTGYSDAYEDSTPWEAYPAAIDAGADFMALTEHVSTSHAYEAWTMDMDEWADLKAAADFYTSPKFVAMPAYEFWLLANNGEVNVYNTPEIPDKMSIKGPGRLADFYDWLAQQPGAIGQFNHPLYVSDNFKDYAFYNETRDVGMNLLEVFNDEFYEDSFIMALDSGWHIMPSSNSDTHYSDWIAGHELRTVLLAKKLTPDDLYEAMSARRGYATMDKNLRIYYTLNGEIMGTIFSEQASSYTANIQVSDPDAVSGDLNDAVTLIEIISDGGAVVSSLPLDSDASAQTINWTVSGLPTDAAYFFVRVSTASNDVTGLAGVTAWTAPVWTGR